MEDPVNTVINFNYFAHNYSRDQLQQVFKQTSASEHLKAKFQQLAHENIGGTPAFYDWFMLLSIGNQRAIVKWINNNYIAFQDFNESKTI